MKANKVFRALLLSSIVFIAAGASCNKQTCKAHLKPDCFYTMQFDPVCGCDGKTYSNAGEASCNSIEVVHKGPCK